MGLKRKQIMFITSGGIVIVVLVVMAVLLHHHGKTRQLSDAKQTVGNHTISLNQATNPSDSGGLSVSGQADSLGQLSGNQSSQGGTNSSSSSGNEVDPSTFSQYEKYQNNLNALFGDVQVGSGATAAAGQKVSIYYKVWLTNGTLVDQTRTDSNGQQQLFSFTLGAGQVISGMEQGVAGMKVGGTRLIIVPPAVGYGSQGQGSIPGNAVLVFEVQLLSAQ